MRNTGFASTAVVTAALMLAGPAPAQSAEDVSCTFDWVVNGTHAGYYVAEDKGYYKDAGLNVTLSRGFGSGDTIKRVGSGASTFGIADTAAVIAARANEDIPVRIVAMVYQKATLGLIYIDKSGIKSPKDLEGRAVGRSASGASVNMFPAFLKANNVDRSKIKEVVVDAATFLPLLMSGRVDAVLEQSVNAGRFKEAAAKEGLKAITMPYADFGLDTYGNAIIVNPKTIAEKPEGVRRFVEASLKGIAYAFAHPEEALSIERKTNPELDAKSAMDELVVMKQVSVTDDVRKHGLGAISEAKMTATRDVVTKALGLKRVVPLQEIYTTDFLPKRPIEPSN